jgi:hypothetical protein
LHLTGPFPLNLEAQSEETVIDWPAVVGASNGDEGHIVAVSLKLCVLTLKP